MPRKGDFFWTEEKLKEGFEKFLREEGRLPTSTEIDRLDYLPSSKQIELRYKGLESLRQLLGYGKYSFRQGEFKTKMMRMINKRGRSIELELEKVLQARFGEIFVHSEKYINNKSKDRIDFLVYSPNGKFGVDVFYPTSHNSFVTSINIKVDRYKNIPFSLYLVVANSDFNQKHIDKHLNSKKTPIPSNFQVVSMENFKNIIEKKGAYKIA